MKIEFGLDAKEIGNAIKQLENYKTELENKAKLFVDKLADVGIRIAKENAYVEIDDTYRNMGDSILFQKNVTLENGDAVCLLVATGKEFIKYWKNGSAIVNPLLMAEFGSGWRAIEGHQGTFPNQHLAFFRPWYWTDSDGTRHSSYGSEPSRPMFKAELEMEKQIIEIAYEVFSA